MVRFGLEDFYQEITMSLFEKWSTAMETDVEGLMSCLHEDYTFVRHQTGSTMN